MALTKQELVSSLQNEVRILLHLAGKVDRSKLDYRPTAKQRSTLELLRYLTIMGRGLVPGILGGAFDGEAWGKLVAAADAKDIDAVIKDVETLADVYTSALGAVTEEGLGQEIELFGHKGSKGYFMVNLVVSGHAAYRTQLFLYLKADGREELNTFNLWQGIDGAMPAQQ